MSVVTDRLSICMISTALAMVFGMFSWALASISVWTHSWTPFRIRWFLFELYSWTVLFAEYLGWLAAPLILTCRFGFSVVRGTPILAGGIGVARFVAGAFLCLLSFVWAS